MSTFEKLVGKTITELWISSDKENIVFVDSEGKEHGFYAYGDCCSNSWIEHMTGLDCLLGHHKVLSAEDMDIDSFNDSDSEHIQVYGITLTTERGHFLFEFRNSSNGYYGGYMEESPYSQMNRAEFLQVKTDF